ncbi:MAG: hypothetical protein HPY83_15245 [Anaerolineae bacterium]|nr:hypothetical protein [Anaerolineae bacterium]
MASPLLALLSAYTPQWVRRRQLVRLLQVTAEAFEVPLPTQRRSCPELLEDYAALTARQAAEALRSGQDLAPIRERLYRGARGMGCDLRHWLHVRTPTQVMAAARLAYRALGIDLKGFPDGSIVVSRCCFARHYSPEVCRLISALDAGLLAGLSGGGRLEFSQRITEGAACCLARLEPLPQ